MVAIRRIAAGDEDGLAALFAGLDAEDRHRRFFSAFGAPRPFLERMVAIAERGGVGLVAIAANEPSGERGAQLVGEASYSLLPNGDGDFAITVAPAWRGGLGAELLSRLVKAAAERLVPNLEGDILIGNRPMLALASRLGSVVMDHPDWTVVRMLIGTGPAGPTWPGRRERGRILVESPASRWWAEEAARRSGVDVLICPGPSRSQPTRASSCPVLRGGDCPLVHGADAVVIAAPARAEAWNQLIDTHRSRTDIPVVVDSGRQAQVLDLLETLPARCRSLGQPTLRPSSQRGQRQAPDASAADQSGPPQASQAADQMLHCMPASRAEDSGQPWP